MNYKIINQWPAESPDLLPFRMASNLATDSEGRAYLVHRGEKPLRVFEPSGNYLGSLGDGHLEKSVTLDLTVTPPRPMTSEYWLHGLHIDSWDYIWITDLGRHTVMKLTLQGELVMTLGTPDVAGSDNFTFNKPTSVVVSPSGEIYVADGYGNSRIVKFSPDGKFLLEWGERGEGPGEFSTPHTLALDPMGNVIVADRLNDRVQVFDPNGLFLAQWGNIPQPDSLAVLPDSSVIVGTGRGTFRLHRYSTSGDLLDQFGAYETLGYPHGIHLDSTGALYVADSVSDDAAKPPLKLALFNPES